MGSDTRFWVEEEERRAAQKDKALLAAETAKRIEAERELDEARRQIAVAISVIGRDRANESLEQIAHRVCHERQIVESALAYFTAYRTNERGVGSAADVVDAGIAQRAAHAALLAAVLRSFPEVTKP